MIRTEQITSEQLAANVIGDPSTRDLVIYLPPSYASSTRRYPTVPPCRQSFLLRPGLLPQGSLTSCPQASFPSRGSHSRGRRISGALHHAGSWRC